MEKEQPTLDERITNRMIRDRSWNFSDIVGNTDTKDMINRQLERLMRYNNSKAEHEIKTPKNPFENIPTILTYRENSPYIFQTNNPICIKEQLKLQSKNSIVRF